MEALFIVDRTQDMTREARLSNAYACLVNNYKFHVKLKKVLKYYHRH